MNKLHFACIHGLFSSYYYDIIFYQLSIMTRHKPDKFLEVDIYYEDQIKCYSMIKYDMIDEV